MKLALGRYLLPLSSMKTTIRPSLSPTTEFAAMDLLRYKSSSESQQNKKDGRSNSAVRLVAARWLENSDWLFGFLQADWSARPTVGLYTTLKESDWLFLLPV